MNKLKYILKTIRFYKRQHFAVMAGILLTTAVITGALIVGDSIKFSLRKITESRLGQIQFVLHSNDRFVRAQLANDISQKLHVKTTPVILLQGVATNPENNTRINHAQVIGIDSSFWNMSTSPMPALNNDEAIISTTTAKKLNLKINDDIVIRIEKLSVIPVNSPFSVDEVPSVSFRLKIKAFADDNHLGRFSLKSNQVAPYNIFISNTLVRAELDMAGLANAILIAGSENNSSAIFNNTVSKIWQLKDAGIVLNKLDEKGNYEITSDRIFIDKQISTAILKQQKPVQTILSYLVNTIKYKNAETPYSFVAAVSENFYGKEVKDHEIIINQWLADDIHASIGDTISMTYFIIDPLQNLKEKSSRFVVKEIIPTRHNLINRSLMPKFPGFAKAVSCMEWNSNIPIDMKRIRDKDEAYWNEFRGTPKAVISIKAGHTLWQNKYGDYTSIRFNDSIFTTASSSCTINPAILKTITPSDLNLYVVDVKTAGIEASQNGVDFGELFLSLSFFVILAGIILTSMLYVLSLQVRQKEVGVLKSLGFTKKDVLHLRLLENLIIILVGSLLGVIAGIAYNFILLQAINSVWNDILRTNMMDVSIQPLTLFTGFISSVLLSFGIIYCITVKSLKKTVITLINTNSNSRQRTPLKPTKNKINSLTNLAIHNVIHNKTRSITIVALLALGIFVLLLTAANRKNNIGNDSRNQSGTGGYKLWAESSVPFTYAINTAKGKEKLGLPQDTAFNNVTFFPMLSLHGNDASCLNLNKVTTPRIIGLNASALNQRHSFSFDELAASVNKKNPWLELNKTYGNNIIPAYADQTVITWGMMKKIGDTISYSNEAGKDLKLILIGGLSASVFQGNILISERHFREHFPSINNTKLMLIDLPENKIKSISNHLSQYLQDYGLDIIPTTEKLNQFNSISNTYLSVFMILGGLGVLLGTIGMGIILYRNILDRKQEIALLMALGYTRKMIKQLLFTEHVLLLIAGIFSGLLSALIFLLPSFLSPGFTFPERFVFFILVLIFINAISWIYFPLKKALNKNIIKALRNE